MQAQSTARAATLADAVIPRSGLLVDAALVVGFAFFTAVFAQIAIRFPGTTVPITGQTLAMLVTGGALGSKRGALSMLVYMLMGMFLLPVFAPSSSLLNKEIVHFILPWAGTGGHVWDMSSRLLVWDMSSGGYIVGFVLGAYLVGFLAERGWDRRARVSLAMVVGNLSVYVVGLPWLAWFIAFSTIPGYVTYYEYIGGDNVLDKTLKGGLYPFIGGDALKLLLAAMVLPGAWELVRRFRGEPPQGK